jgi:hypothetical protein
MGPWERYGGGQQATPPQGMVVGTPRPPDPFKVRDQQLQEESAARAREDQQFQRQKFEREMAQKDEAKVTDGAKTAAGYYSRALRAHQGYGGGVAPRGAATQFVVDQLPTGFVNEQSSPERRAAQNYADEFIRAKLRRESGASIAPEEMRKEYEVYFPIPGDTQADFERKKALREQAIEGLRNEAGPAAESVNILPVTNAPAPDEDVVAFVKANSNLRPDQLRALAKAQLGRDIDNADELLAHFAKTGQISNEVQTPSPNTEAFKAGVGDLVEGVGDVVGLVANPLNAGINWAFGTDLGTDFGQSLRDVTGLPDGDPTASAINKAGIGALTGSGLANAARGVASGPVASAVADTVASQPIRQGIGGAGAGYASEKARQAGLGPLGQAGAGLLGGLAGYGGSNALLGLAERVTAGPNHIAQTAQRHGVQLMPADVGGPVTRRVSGAAMQTPFSAEPVINAAKRTQDQIGEATSRIARKEGEVLAPDDAGLAVREAGQAFSTKQSQRIGRVYERAEERAKGVTIKPLQAVSVIDEQIARLSQLGETNAPLIRSLEKLKSDISGGVKVSGMRDARTSLSQGVYDGKLRSNQEKQIYKSVIEALSGDIEAGLSAAGRKDSLNLFKVADKAWKERIEYIDSVLEPVIGQGKSGESILNAVESMAKGKSGGVRRLQELMREMPPEQAGNIRATIIDRIGKAKSGQQDDSGEVFSAQTFLTRWSDMSPKGRAALFGDSELRRNLDDIAKISSATKQSGKYASTSNSPGGILANMGILMAGGYASPKLAVIAGGTQFLTGRLMASPRFTAWLARMPENPAAVPQYANRLKQIAAQEPIIANDIQSVQNFLNSNSYRAAASPENQTEQRR